MAAQVVLNGGAQHPIGAPALPHAAPKVEPPKFQIRAQDERLYQGVTGPAQPPPPLGVLSSFTGTFVGTGLNTIFRPNSGPPTTTTFPIPVTFPATGPGNDNVLELNLTTETLEFKSPLGSVPNRGEKPQTDIFLNGVPYNQTVNDVTNCNTGKGDNPPSAIHFEPGLWMHVPATTLDPVLGESLARMGSIPHGTTINAQCLEPTTTIPGAPDFSKLPKVDITPFVVGSNPPKLVRFLSQTANNKDTPRLPQDLTKFIEAGTITQDILDNPNVVLANANKGKNITRFSVFTVSTAPKAPELGGGTANIAFLTGGTTSPEVGPNANAVLMQATFWIEEVQHDIKVPSFTPGQAPLKIQPPPAHPGAHTPTFHVEPPHEILEERTISVTSTQIQYQQTVNLNFAGLTWPHVSVATLVPKDDLVVPAAAWK